MAYKVGWGEILFPFFQKLSFVTTHMLTPGVGGGEGGGGGGDAMRALLASYYGLAAQEPAKKEFEIDAAEFDAEAYVRKMLLKEVGSQWITISIL